MENLITLRLESKNPFIRLGALLKIKKVLQDYRQNELHEYDQQLILGILDNHEIEELV